MEHEARHCLVDARRTQRLRDLVTHHLTPLHCDTGLSRLRPCDRKHRVVGIETDDATARRQLAEHDRLRARAAADVDDGLVCLRIDELDEAPAPVSLSRHQRDHAVIATGKLVSAERRYEVAPSSAAAGIFLRHRHTIEASPAGRLNVAVDAFAVSSATTPSAQLLRRRP